jgi:hypothetical protein
LGDLLAGDPLIGKKLYAFVGNLSTLASSTAYALYLINTFVEEETGFGLTYLAQPKGITPLIGSIDSITINAPLAAGSGGALETYSTLKLVPEPSSALLGAVGALALLRRRRK